MLRTATSTTVSYLESKMDLKVEKKWLLCISLIKDSIVEDEFKPSNKNENAIFTPMPRSRMPADNVDKITIAIQQFIKSTED